MIDIDDTVLADGPTRPGHEDQAGGPSDAALRRVAYGGQQRRVVDLFAADPDLAGNLLDVVAERHQT